MLQSVFYRSEYKGIFLSIQEKIQEIKEDLDLFDDEMDKYEYIIDFGKSLTPLADEYKTTGNLVQGCTSKVWLVSEEKEGKLYFEVDSEAIIVRGLVRMVRDIFSGQEASVLQSIDINLLGALELKQIITPSRQNGVAGMIKKIQQYAKDTIK